MFVSILNFKHVYQNFNSSEDGLFLDQEILLHKGILASAIPQIKS